ncbi:histidine-containing phosphotransfer protein 2-like [Asparagus officinalis]|uniref:histidine-containing phosphotransfer protein 2-like n=1 Tax=Asparagus officinalis TaxID=4686 RepID=UPI00098E4C4E|nr:histidine-containing phosphotransfer protein 2-like [Asparagus officinalis]
MPSASSTRSPTPPSSPSAPSSPPSSTTGGLLDQQFNQLLILEEDGGEFLVEVIKLFCDDSKRMISELSSLIDQPVVDFQNVGSFVHQLKGSSSR